MKKRLAAVLLSVLICVPLSAGVYAEDLPDMTALETAAPVDNSLPAKSAILIEQESGRVLFEKNADEVLPPASITKVMTLLLVIGIGGSYLGARAALELLRLSLIHI